jgi:pilus assembly protein FimV
MDETSPLSDAGDPGPLDRATDSNAGDGVDFESTLQPDETLSMPDAKDDTDPGMQEFKLDLADTGDLEALGNLAAGDLDDLDIADTGSSPADDGIGDAGTVEFDVDTLGGLSAPTFGASEPQPSESETGDEPTPSGGEAADWDETATKLDLAKAYIDMGDESGARNILEEVLSEGNETQRRQAQELVSQLGSGG